MGCVPNLLEQFCETREKYAHFLQTASQMLLGLVQVPDAYVLRPDR